LHENAKTPVTNSPCALLFLQITYAATFSMLCHATVSEAENNAALLKAVLKNTSHGCTKEHFSRLY